MRSKILICRTLTGILLIVLSLCGGFSKTAVAAETISAKISSEKVEKGKTVQIVSKTKDVTYKSSDTSIAYVDGDGVVIGKKKGIVSITVKKAGYSSKKFTVTVTSNGKKPNIYVWYDEIELADEQLDNGIYTAKVINNSTEELNKVHYVYTAEVKSVTDAAEETNVTDAAEETNVTDTAEEKNAAAEEAETTIENTDNAKTENKDSSTQESQQTHTIIESTMTLEATVSNIPGKGEAKKIEIEAPEDGEIQSIQLQKVYVYTKSALIIYDVVNDRYTYGWGTKDKTAPVISGLTEKDSYFGDTVFMTVYPDIDYDYTKYVLAEDNRDLEVSLSVDTSKVNFKKEGNYTITYTASDSAGNTSNADSKVHVRIPKKVDKMADEVLKEIVDEKMTDQEKITALYTYMRKNYTYVGNYEEDNWEEAAEYGLKFKSGDCFAYYSISRLLLTRLGIPNMMITRYRGEGHHWWNLVYVKGGWYHFDSTPRSVQAMFCLVTSAQLEEYSKKAGDTHIWDITKYPETATKKISKVVMNKRY